MIKLSNLRFSKNYFSAFSFLPSSWIANLGVVPLLMFAAFLLCPILTFFLDLLFFVTRVFETIFILLTEHIFKYIKFFNNKCLYLPRLLQIVKASPLVFMILVANTALCKSHNIKLKTSEIIMAKGQHTEIKDINADHYTIGNKEIISHKFYPKEKKLIIKGKMLGYSEILIWKKNKKTQTIKVYVFSKKEHLGLLSLANSIKGLGLKANIKGPIITISGKIQELSNYILYRKLVHKNSDRINERVILARPLINKLIGEVYYLFFNQYIDDIKCRPRFSRIHCYYSDSNSPNKNSLKVLKDKYGIKFFTHNYQNQAKNYRIKIKLVQMEKLGGEELNLGLDQLDTSLIDIINKGVVGVVANNRVKLNNQNIQISTLAEPTALIGLKTPLIIKIGDEVPYSNLHKNQNTTLWKFAGLKIMVKLTKKGSAFELKYTTMLKKPGANRNITGSEEKSSIFIRPGKPVELFSIGFQTIKDSKSSFPLLSKIPVLGNLFISKSYGKNHKRITGIIILEETKLR